MDEIIGQIRALYEEVRLADPPKRGKKRDNAGEILSLHRSIGVVTNNL